MSCWDDVLFRNRTSSDFECETDSRAIGGAAEQALTERMVQGGVLPGGMPAPDLPAGPGPHQASKVGAVIGNAASNTIANSPPIVEELFN